jgi:hypothetical protein
MEYSNALESSNLKNSLLIEDIDFSDINKNLSSNQNIINRR